MRGFWLVVALLLLASGLRADETWTTAVLVSPAATSPGLTDVLPIIQSNATHQMPYSLLRQSFGISAIAPTVPSGGCTGGAGNVVSFNNGTAAFAITLGSLPCGSTLALAMPNSTNGWVCDAHDITAPAFNAVDQTAGGSATSVTLTDYVRGSAQVKSFTENDVIVVKCVGY